ncbi:MAG: isoamylase early set domain-containing protein [Deltaproteobacteria bacterium]|nr:isoamylase early set domain-containing protein [Deltaproteobacteria bacterium]
MPISITRLKSRPTVCKVSFKLDAQDAAGAEQAFLTGSFNNWDTASHPMKRNKNGSFSLDVELPKGEEVSFRYLLGDGRWLNEKAASEFRYCAFADADNSVLKL